MFDRQALPANYNFEIHKSVWRLKSAGARCVALQVCSLGPCGCFLGALWVQA